jgi:hypothetical protein
MSYLRRWLFRFRLFVGGLQYQCSFWLGVFFQKVPDSPLSKTTINGETRGSLGSSGDLILVSPVGKSLLRERIKRSILFFCYPATFSHSTSLTLGDRERNGPFIPVLAGGNA